MYSLISILRRQVLPSHAAGVVSGMACVGTGVWWLYIVNGTITAYQQGLEPAASDFFWPTIIGLLAVFFAVDACHGLRAWWRKQNWHAQAGS